MKLPSYPRMKPTNVEWVADVPHHWEVKRLKWSVTCCFNGVWGDEPDGIDDVVCVRVADFNRDNFTVTADGLTLRSIDSNQREKRKLRKGDLLLEKSGGGDKQLVGCVAYFDHDFEAVCSNFIARMPAEAPAYARYWCYVHAGLYAGKLTYPAIKQTTGIQNLDAECYLNTLVAYPPPAEQQQIAAFLDWKTGQIDVLIKRKQELLEKLKEKRLAVITQAVTRGLNPAAPLRETGIPWLGEVPEHWDVLRIGRMITLQRGVDITKDEQEEGEVPVVSSGGVDSYHNIALVKGPGVIVGRKGTAGAVHYVESDYWPHDTTLYVRDFWGNHPRYVYYKLLSMDLASYDTGTANPTVNRNIVHPVKVSWPPVGEQLAIADYLDRISAGIDALMHKVLEAIDRLTEYRTALITAATTGKIDVRNVKIPKSDQP